MCYEWQNRKSAEARPRAADWLSLEAQPGEAADDTLYCELTFESGHRHAGASMGAGRECQVGIRRTRDVEPVWLRKHLRIPICRSDAQMQVRTGLELRACDPHRLDDEPVTELVRAFAA